MTALEVKGSVISSTHTLKMHIDVSVSFQCNIQCATLQISQNAHIIQHNVLRLYQAGRGCVGKSARCMRSNQQVHVSHSD